jgi:LDH2 family malate/lactate/ureidoglycolate dehydrogenase
MVSALFSGVLTQAAHTGERGGGGVLMVAIDAGAFGPRDQAIADADSLMDKIKAVPPAAGVSEVLSPGEPEARSRQRRGQEGVPVPEATWREIGETASSLGVSLE